MKNTTTAFISDSGAFRYSNLGTWIDPPLELHVTKVRRDRVDGRPSRARRATAAGWSSSRAGLLVGAPLVDFGVRTCGVEKLEALPQGFRRHSLAKN